jgi:lipopolysaccharide transport system ATP-binding protein
MTDAISVEKVSKYYSIWRDPAARLKHPLLDMLSRAVPPIRPWIERSLHGMMWQFHALEDVSFSVQKGECVGILGRNGSGKSTLLRIIAGVLQPTSGAVSVQGRIAALLELGSGFNPQFTGRQNVYMNAAILGLTREETDARFDAIAAFADIGNFLDQPVKTYSSGMAVRLAFAVSATVDPDILIVDEALSVGDEAFQRKCFARLERLRERGSTILFVSHGASTIVQLCDRAVLLHAGRLILSGRPKLVVGRYQRLLYAPESEHARLLAEIGELAGRGEAAQPAEERVPGEASSSPRSAAAAEYDPNLSSPSRLEYPTRGAQIENVRIEDENGRKVNVLPRGGKYQFCYDVELSEPHDLIRAGFMIKTLAGFEIGGGVSHPAGEGVRELKPGDSLAVRFTFFARLTAGTYFLNAGIVSSSGPDAIEYLHRVVDAVAFRVPPEAAPLMTGLADMIDGAPPCEVLVHAGREPVSVTA